MKVQHLPFCCALLTLFFCCNNKQPFKPDYEIGTGIIIGREECAKDPLKNAWLIQLIRPTINGKTFGEITYNNKKYSNVVKAYNLADSLKVDGKTYGIDFYIESNPKAQECEVENPTTFEVTNIRIKMMSRVTVVSNTSRK